MPVVKWSACDLRVMPKVAGGSDSIKHQSDAPGVGGLFHAGHRRNGRIKQTEDKEPNEIGGTREGAKLVSGMM